MRSTKPLKVIAGAADRPLVIGNIEIQCYVLEDETRVLSQGGFLTALGRHGRPQAKAKDQVEELPRFIESANLKPFVHSDLIKSSKPILFRSVSGGRSGMDTAHFSCRKSVRFTLRHAKPERCMHHRVTLPPAPKCSCAVSPQSV